MKNLLELALLSVVVVTSFALSLNAKNIKPVLEKIKNQRLVKSYAPLPILKEGSTFPVLSAQAVLAQDVNSKVALYQKNPDKALLPASTTKIITALVALDYYPLDTVLEVNGIKVDGQKMNLVSGEKIRVRDLIEGLLVYSANDAAVVLAKNFPGGEEAFILAMNEKARAIGLADSNFTHPAGLDGMSQATTARDLLKAATYAMEVPYFAGVVSKKETTVTSIDGKIVHRLTNTNKLLGAVPGVYGVKTGWTENARENLITYLERDGRRIMIVLLGSQDRFGETRELINWIFANYSWAPVTYTTVK